ncbi:MAG TPA: hypothetical protein VHV83_05565 [Armatimonadota bacterium]|nr:hypothetical protein [Armatimonadota bacterium]
MADPDMLYDINLKDADIHQVLDDFFKQAGRAYTIDDPLDGAISVHAADLNFQDALELMLPKNYEATEIGEIYHIRRNPEAA